MGCHLISHERGKEVPVYVRARTQGWEVRGARSLAQIVFYRPSRFASVGRRDDRDQVGRFLFFFFAAKETEDFRKHVCSLTTRRNAGILGILRREDTPGFGKVGRNVFIGRRVTTPNVPRPTNSRCRGYKIGERAF